MIILILLSVRYALASISMYVLVHDLHDVTYSANDYS